MIQRYFIFLLIVCSSVFTSCYKENDIEGQISDEFYLRHEGTDFPIWTRGYDQTETFIIFLHGGPFASGIREAVNKQFVELEKDYVMVYYDQRGGGFTHGENNIEKLNEKQFVEDLDEIVDLIKSKYTNAKNVFLMGHSWGGYLGTAYLASDNNQNKIKGWIGLAGAHNQSLSWEESRLFSIDYATKQITNNSEDKVFWEEQLDILINTPIIFDLATLQTINFPAQVIEEKGIESVNGDNDISGLELLSSPIGYGINQTNLTVVEDIVVNGNQNPRMNQITIPSLLLYGGIDAIVPASMGQNGYDFLGTPEVDKQLVILENRGHDLWRFEPILFFTEVKQFIEKYN